MSFTSVIVGTDGSVTAGEAVRHAAGLAARSGARLVVVTAYRGDAIAEAEREAEVPDELKWLVTDRSEAEELARTANDVARAEGVERIVLRAEEGDAAEVLVDAAEEFAADVIVVGSKGLTSAARYLGIGSVASNVTHHAPCDVLIVHTV